MEERSEKSESVGVACVSAGVQGAFVGSPSLWDPQPVTVDMGPLAYILTAESATPKPPGVSPQPAVTQS